MKIKSLKIHNFRSIKDLSINLDDYSLLIGENNAGKTNIMTAIRLFYEDEGIKYNGNTDFPKFKTDDQESWMEIEYITSQDEQDTLKMEYRSPNRILKVRRYFISDSRQSSYYAYENGTLSQNQFYGAKNISQAKLGKVIYIPDISKTDDTFKLTGPSPFRNMVNYVMNKLMKNSNSYKELAAGFEKFNCSFKEEATKDGFSLKSMTEDINEEIKNWKVKFGIDINPIKSDDIVKNLISQYMEDENFDKNQRVNINCYGQGLQRNLIFTLIKLSAKYVDKNVEKKNDFSPDFTFILFEEPEAFLHPSQQEYLNLNLKKLSLEEDQQILITTHSPVFVCKNISDFTGLINIKKGSTITASYQLSEDDIDNLFNENMSMFKMFSNMLNDPSVSEEVKKKIRNKNLGDITLDEEKKLEEESLRYFIWLDIERASLFFAKHVIMCEGASEKVLFDYLFNNDWSDLQEKHIYNLDCMGKFNIHRYMNLFSKLGITHSIIMDGDMDVDIQGIINQFIEDNKNEYTQKKYNFSSDVEGFLGIPKPPNSRNDLKPLNIMKCYQNSQIPEGKINELRTIVDNLLLKK